MAKYRYQLKNGYFEFYGDNVQEILKGEATQAMLKSIGDGVAGRAGVGFVGEAKVYKKRAAYNVKADTVRARRSNLKHNTLLKALGGGK